MYLRDHLLLGKNADVTIVIVNDQRSNFEEEFALIFGFQFDFRRVALYFNRRAKGL